MPFTFSEQHITDYYHNGYTVFQSILPSSLVQDLRRVTDRAREIIREDNGPQVQRMQPVGKYADRIDMQPFHDYEETSDSPVLIFSRFDEDENEIPNRFSKYLRDNQSSVLNIELI